jgi:hypothetical protein
MKSLLDAIQTAFNQNPDLNSAYGTFPGGLEVSQAADSEALPLCVLTVLPPAPGVFSTGSHTVVSPYVETIYCQFTVYSTDPTFVQNAEAWLDETFNRVSLPALNGDYCLFSRRNGGGNPYKDLDGRTWRADYQYQFVVQRGL